jgi:hypothetical protein
MRYRGILSRENGMNSLLQVDTLVPLEFLERVKRTTYQDPERALMVAVLRDAITCLEKYAAFRSSGNKRLFDEAIEWILSDDCEGLFSFNNVCEAVGVNPGYLRRGLIRMSERSSTPAPGLRRRVALIRTNRFAKDCRMNATKEHT